MYEARPVSGKKVVILTILALIAFTAIMLIGTFAFARWLTPILQKKQAPPVKATSAPSPSNRS